MDPYIEQPSLWGDFHNDLAAEIRSHLNEAIRPRYFARLIPYVTYESLGIGEVSRTYPDVSIFQARQLREAVVPSMVPAPVAVMEPTAVESEVRQEFPLRLHSVEVYTVIETKLVTVIEILSPVNKRPSHEAYQHYLNKRRQILNTPDVHLLEIDLLRGGQRPPLERSVPMAPYYIMLSRAVSRPKVIVWPIQLKEKLPTVPVPLRAPDLDVTLDLGRIVADVYERGAYDLQLDYTKDPPPPKLYAEEAAWVQQHLQTRGVLFTTRKPFLAISKLHRPRVCCLLRRLPRKWG
jgi:hypothetical protein